MGDARFDLTDDSATTFDVPEDNATTRTSAPSLADADRVLLDFERRWWRRPGAKEQAILEAFECSSTRYYQRLNALLDDPSALAYDPVLVERLRRLRRTRRSPHST